MVSISRRYEILVMDDDSTDDTVPEIESNFGNDPRVKVTVRTRDRGLANSIYDGIMKAQGEFVLVMDSDFNHDPAVTSKMVRFTEDYDIVSGSRFTTGGGMQSAFRQWGSFMFNLCVRILLVLPTQDNLAGFYCIRKRKLLELDLEEIFRNYGDYFFRLLYRAHERNFRILEIPVWYRDRDYGVSKTPFVRTLLLYTREALRLRLRLWFKS
jgi:dolichol-phosphate mannosyltransferase